MRNLIYAGLIIVAVGVMGCGSGNADKAEKAQREMLAEMMKIADAMETGNRTAIKTSMERYKAIKNENKNLKITVKEKKSIEEKLAKDIESGKKRFTDIVVKETTTAKLFSRDEMVQILKDLESLDK